MNKGLVTTIGFILFAIGFLSILLSLVGLQLSAMKWLTYFNGGVALVLKLIMLFAGLIIMYVSKLPPERD